MKKPIRYVPVNGEKAAYYAYADDDILDVFKMRGMWIAMLGGYADEGKTRDQAVQRAQVKFNQALKAAKREQAKKGR